MRTARRTVSTLGILLFLASAAQAGFGVWTSNGPYGDQVFDVVFHRTLPNIAYAATFGGVYKTADGGVTWSFSGSSFRIRAVSIALRPTMPSTLYAATTSGVFKTTDAGDTWVSTDNGLPDFAICEAIVVDPTSDTVYAATRTDGLYQSTDGAGSWMALDNGLPSDVRDIAVDTTQTSTVWAATPGGVYRSLDTGASWTRQFLTSQVNAVAVDPADGTRVFAGTLSALYRSTDGGTSWTLADPHRVFDIAVDPANPSIVYVSGSQGRVRKSSDGGATWGDAGSGLLGQRLSRLAIAPSDPNQLLVGTDLGLFMSIDGADRWNERNQGMVKPAITGIVVDPTDERVVYASTGSGFFKSTDGGDSWRRDDRLSAFVFFSLALDLDDPNQVFVATTESISDRVFRSSDAGKTWETVETGLPDGRTSSLRATAAGSVFAITNEGPYRTDDRGMLWYPANHGVSAAGGTKLVVDPRDPETLFLATFGDVGVYKSVDGGMTWTATSDGLPSTSVFDIGIVPGAPDTLFAASGSGWFKTTTGGAAWQALPDQWEGLKIGFDPVDQKIIYLGSPGVRKTTDGGMTFEEMNQGLPVTASGILLSLFGGIEVDPHQPLRLWLATTQGVYKRTQALFVDSFESADTSEWDETVQ